MFDWFEDAPEWCRVVIHWSELDYVAYLETDKQGESGRIKVLKRGVPIPTAQVTPHDHIWWNEENQSQVVARRDSKHPQTATRYLTEEEVAILSDIGMLEEALKQQGVEMPPVGERTLQVNIWDENEDIVYCFDEHCEEDNAVTVEQFFEVVEAAYDKLGFQNKVTISADFGTTGFNKILGES